jgi:hypothetical protein
MDMEPFQSIWDLSYFNVNHLPWYKINNHEYGEYKLFDSENIIENIFVEEMRLFVESVKKQ